MLQLALLLGLLQYYFIYFAGWSCSIQVYYLLYVRVMMYMYVLLHACAARATEHTTVRLIVAIHRRTLSLCA